MWLSDVSIKRPVFITMVTIGLVVVGWLAYTRMPVDLFPDISVPVVAVRTIYAGATPQEIETLISRPVERAVSSLGRVKEVRSTSNESVSLVIVEFDMDYSAKEAVDEVRQRVNSIRGDLPSDANDPEVLRFDPSSAPILSLAVSDHQNSRDPYQLRQLVEDEIVPQFDRVPGVAAVSVSGGLQREIQVDLSLDRLQALGLPVQQVISAIKGENVNIPGGRLPAGEQERLLRVAGQFTSVDQLGTVPVTTPRGASVYLRDIATITDGYKEVRTKSRLDGQDSILIYISKQSGTNTVAVAEETKRRLQAIEQEYPDLSLAIMEDQSVFTRESTQDVMITLLLGGVLAALVVFGFFRSVRNTIVTVIGLPIIVISTFFVMWVMGFSLNMISLLALSLSIGMLVDDAIVVRENIFRHTEEGLDPREAASKATGEIALAVIATTLTIVAVFAPIGFTGGIAGKFLREFGLTIVAAVMISLFEAFTLAPMLSAYFFRPTKKDLAESSRQLGAYGRVDRVYRGWLAWALRNRVVVVLVGVGALAGSVLVLSTLQRSFLNDFDRGDVTVNLEMAPGTTLDVMEEVTRQAEELILRRPEVAHVVSIIGSEDGGTEKSSLKIKMVGYGYLDKFQYEIRPELAKLPGVRFDIDMQANSLSGMMTSTAASVMGRPLQIVLHGEDTAVLEQASQQVAQALATVPGVVDIDSSQRAGKPETQVVVDRVRAADLGISTAQIGSTIRALVNGERASGFAAGDHDVDITVRMQPADRSDIASIEQIPLLTPKGTLVPLSAIATLQQGEGPAQIERLDRQREVTIGASYLGRELGEVVNDASAVLAKLTLPAGVTYSFGGTTQYMEEAFSSLLFAALLSVGFVYMVLASQFGSFVHPFTVMLALPLSLLGAFVALRISGDPLDMVGLIGIVLLMGLVTKNSILLVDYTNTLRGRGLARNDAVLAAGPVRLRPILMTTISTISGMVPIALGFGAGGEIRKPMAVAVIGGMLTSTLLTLIVIPVAYTLVDDLGRKLHRVRARRASPAVESAAARPTHADEVAEG
ncbi:MAG: efflux RND transporter permease subunit [Dehalococcoidales bacterium]|nr:efflux RND transporter permease subunit [Dehalococcoidales bacterium]